MATYRDVTFVPVTPRPGALAALLDVGTASGRIGDFHADHAKKWHAHGKQAGSSRSLQDSHVAELRHALRIHDSGRATRGVLGFHGRGTRRGWRSWKSRPKRARAWNAGYRLAARHNSKRRAVEKKTAFHAFFGWHPPLRAIERIGNLWSIPREIMQV